MIGPNNIIQIDVQNCYNDNNSIRVLFYITPPSTTIVTCDLNTKCIPPLCMCESTYKSDVSKYHKSWWHYANRKRAAWILMHCRCIFSAISERNWTLNEYGTHEFLERILQLYFVMGFYTKPHFIRVDSRNL